MPNLGLPDQILLSGPFHAGPTLRVPGFISGGPDAEAPVAFFRSKNTALGTTLLLASSQWKCKGQTGCVAEVQSRSYGSCTPRARKC
jgi:hypothetical protein